MDRIAGPRAEAGRLMGHLRATVAQERRRAGGSEGEQGFGLVETMIALVILAMVIVPVTSLTITTMNASNNMRLRAEASDLATQRLAVVAYSAENGQQWAEGVTSDVEQSGTSSFNVAIDAEPENAATLCASGGQPQAWSAQATVSWGTGTAAQQVAAGNFVRQSTIIPAPPSQGPSGTAAEIAIPVYQAANPAALETAAPVTITVTGSCSAGQSCTPAGQIPSGLVTTESASTGSSGCAVFPNLYAGTGYSYTATVTNANGYVDSSEHSGTVGIAGAATQPSLANVVSVTPGAVTTPKTGFLLAPADQPLIQFSSQTYGNGTAPAPAADLPITVVLAGTPCSTGCMLGDGATAFNGTSQLAPLYPSTGYQGWAGGPSATPSKFTGQTNMTFSSSTPTVSFNVYPLRLSVTEGTGISSVGFTAVSVADSDSITLATAGAASGSPAVAPSATGMPLGEYQVEPTTGTLSYTSGGTTSHQLYVWMTPAGVCASAAPMTPNPGSLPCASPSTSAIAVSVS